MKDLYNNQKLKEKRGALRKAQTDAGRKMWQILRNRQTEGLKFFRQYSVDNYISDLLLPSDKISCLELRNTQNSHNRVK